MKSLSNKWVHRSWRPISLHSQRSDCSPTLGQTSEFIVRGDLLVSIHKGQIVLLHLVSELNSLVRDYTVVSFTKTASRCPLFASLFSHVTFIHNKRSVGKAKNRARPILILYTGLFWSCTLAYFDLVHWPILILYIGLFWSCILAYFDLVYWPNLIVYSGLFSFCTLAYFDLVHWSMLILYTGLFWSCRLAYFDLVYRPILIL